MKFIHTGKLDSLVEKVRAQATCLHARLAGHQFDVWMAGDLFILVRRPDRNQPCSDTFVSTESANNIIVT
jgi:hypothetical protein